MIPSFSYYDLPFFSIFNYYSYSFTGRYNIYTVSSLGKSDGWESSKAEIRNHPSGSLDVVTLMLEISSLQKLSNIAFLKRKHNEFTVGAFWGGTPLNHIKVQRLKHHLQHICNHRQLWWVPWAAVSSPKEEKKGCHLGLRSKLYVPMGDTVSGLSATWMFSKHISRFYPVTTGVSRKKKIFLK